MILCMFVIGCAKNTPQNNVSNLLIARQICEPIYGTGKDWDCISENMARQIYRHNRKCEEIRKKS